MQKPLVLLLAAAFVVLSTLVVLLYHNKEKVQLQNRELIIENDSILSVNILLADSVKQKNRSAALQEKSLGRAGKKAP